MTLLIDPKLIGTVYANLADARLRWPVHRSLWPNQETLKQHRTWAGL